MQKTTKCANTHILCKKKKEKQEEENPGTCAYMYTGHRRGGGTIFKVEGGTKLKWGPNFDHWGHFFSDWGHKTNTPVTPTLRPCSSRYVKEKWP